MTFQEFRAQLNDMDYGEVEALRDSFSAWTPADWRRDVWTARLELALHVYYRRTGRGARTWFMSARNGM